MATHPALLDFPLPDLQMVLVEGETFQMGDETLEVMRFLFRGLNYFLNYPHVVPQGYEVISKSSRRFYAD